MQALELAAEEAIGDVDILLTCEWPADVTAATPPGSAPAEASTAGQSLRTGFTTCINANYAVPTLLYCPAQPDDTTLPFGTLATELQMLQHSMLILCCVQ